MNQQDAGSVDNVWTNVLDRLQPRVADGIFSRMLRPLQPVLLTDTEIRLLAPNRSSFGYVTENLLGVLAETVGELVGPRRVVVDLSPEGQGELFPTEEQALKGKIWPGRLNPRYTFERFVVGASNQFAHAGARAVAAKPGRHYNPFFIYGGVGLGKTHLVHAIAFEVLRNDPSAHVTYLSSEEFTTELVSSIRQERMEEFKDRFRQADVLIVDDVQLMAGRDRTQEEFFHTFNVLHSAGRQIVLTSDVPPHDINGLEERLRNRFEWGLIADIQSPDLETRAAIVERKAELDGIPLDADAAVLIAKHVVSNVRELEGVLTRLGARASMDGSRISAGFVEEILSRQSTFKPVTLGAERIVDTVCEHFSVERHDLHSRRRSHHLVVPRQLAMYLCRTYLGTSYPRIGELFQRDHSTAIHAVDATQGRLKEDAAFRDLVERVERALGVRP